MLNLFQHLYSALNGQMPKQVRHDNAKKTANIKQPSSNKIYALLICKHFHQFHPCQGYAGVLI